MKAAVINGFGKVPQYMDFSEPAMFTNGTLIHVKASVLENFDKGVSSGKHYSSQKLFPEFPAIVGNDGVGITEEGKMVSFGRLQPPYGAFAERVVAGYAIPVPDGIDAAVASAVPPSALTSLLPLKYSAKLEPGETVLINGATGVSGRIAVQVAKMLGAGKVIAAGRNESSLQLLSTLGADELIDLKQTDEQVSEAFHEVHKKYNIDVVIDFIWGHPAELLIGTFIPREAGFAKTRTRYVHIGGMAGLNISLPGSALRTSGLELMGIGKLSFDIVQEEAKQIWDWIINNKLYMDIERVPLSEIADAWQRKELNGKRLVIVP